MNFKTKVIFTVLSFAIAALMLSVSNNGISQHKSFIAVFAQENEAEVEADIEQENKCKKDTECENENEINNSLDITNTTQTGTGQLTVIKEVSCSVVQPGSITQTSSQSIPVLLNTAFIPVGFQPCIDFAEELEPQDFEFTVTGNNPNPSSFQGSSSGVVVTLGEGAYDV
ncbi:MAG: hypothetical protein DA328_04745, partial [Nitrososphaeraceae archaeon]|nr:hypothetical protein [Nitrososphaeraceae archaeon]